VTVHVRWPENDSLRELLPDGQLAIIFASQELGSVEEEAGRGLRDCLLEATNFHTTHKRVDLFLHPHAWNLLMFCNYMELLFLNRPQYTWEKFERDSISDALSEDYPTSAATLPEGHKLLTIDKVAPYDVKMCRRAAYFYDKMSIPNPAPPTPFVFPDDD
jgi:hypothetical protein